MVIKTLDHTSFDNIITCFFKAFENYFVPIPNNKELFKSRWENAGVNFRYSYGMFHEDQLVAFIIHAIDHRNGHLTAFNSGTGVLPEYRGQRIVQKIYAQAIPQLKEIGVTKCALEVITQNIKAIKAYERTGFRIHKTFHCYNGSIAPITTHSNLNIERTEVSKIDWTSLPHQHMYSWDHQKETLEKSDFTLFKVYFQDKWESYFIMDTARGYVAQLDIVAPSNNVWNRLFQGIHEISDHIKINNVDSEFKEKIEALEKINLPRVVDQYEMELYI